jgi:hypothetical protein
MTDPLIPAYAAYLALSVLLTVWAGRAFRRHGGALLCDVLGARPELADAVLSLLLVAFYLVNLGAIALRVSEARFSGRAAVSAADPSTHEIVELVANKIGGTLLVLGALHVANLIVLAAIRARVRSARDRDTEERASAIGSLARSAERLA